MYLKYAADVGSTDMSEVAGTYVGDVGNDVGVTFECSEVGSIGAGVVAVQVLLRLTVQIYVAEDGITVATSWGWQYRRGWGCRNMCR